MSAQGFSDWLETPQGRYVLDWEQARHDQLVADIFGFNAVQVGWPGLDFLRANRMPFRFNCDDTRPAPPSLPSRGGDAGSPLRGSGSRDVRALGRPGGADLLSDLHHLPLSSNSVDLVVLPHVLEFDRNPHQILREVERVLVPEGSVVVTGFNPYSLWGMRRSLAKRNPPAPPFGGKYISVPRLKDWFALLGLEPHAGAFGCYAPAVTQEKWLRRFSFLDAAGDRWWPIGGAVYVIQAIKRVHGMRLVMPKWKDRVARAKALVPLAQKTDHQ